MILLSLALVVASAVTLAIGVFSAGDALVWTSLGAGLGAVALVTGSVVRRRRTAALLGDPVGPAPAGAVVFGPASAGIDPAPSPTPARAASAGFPAPPSQPVPAVPAAGEPDPDPDLVRGARPAADAWPWATAPPCAEPGATRGWTGHVPSTRPPAPAPPEGSRPTAPAGPQSAAETPARPSQAGRQRDADPSASSAPDPAGGRPGVAGSGRGAQGVPDGPEVVEDGVEAVAVRDALRVAQFGDEVVVEDGRPRYHLATCPTLAGAATVPLAVSAARRGGFTPCSVCTPDRVLLARSTDRRAEPR